MKKTTTLVMLVALAASVFAQAAPEGKPARPGPRPGFDKLIEDIDTNKDGALSKDEIEAFKAKRKQEQDKPLPEKKGKPKQKEG
jgi:hypothetical protein